MGESQERALNVPVRKGVTEETETKITAPCSP